MITITNDSDGSLNHSGLVPPPNRSTAPSTPVTGSKMNTQTRPMPTPDSTYGANTVARAKVRPRNGRASTVASSNPSTIAPPTVATVKTTVVQMTATDDGVEKNSR